MFEQRYLSPWSYLNDDVTQFHAQVGISATDWPGTDSDLPSKEAKRHATDKTGDLSKDGGSKKAKRYLQNRWTKNDGNDEKVVCLFKKPCMQGSASRDIN